MLQQRRLPAHASSRLVAFGASAFVRVEKREGIARELLAHDPHDVLRSDEARLRLADSALAL